MIKNEPDFLNFIKTPDWWRFAGKYDFPTVRGLDSGLTVIPTAGWSDERSYEFCFDGMPKHSLIAVSSLGTQNDKQAQKLFHKGYEKMQEVLEPSKILFYGKKPDWLDESTVIHVPHVRDQKFKALRAEKENN